MWNNFQLWLKDHPKINGALVVAEGAAVGALGSVCDDFVTGQITFSRSGLHKAAGIMAITVITALRMAYGRNPKAPAGGQ